MEQLVSFVVAPAGPRYPETVFAEGAVREVQGVAEMPDNAEEMRRSGELGVIRTGMVVLTSLAVLAAVSFSVSSPAVNLVHVESHPLDPGTHRPELLATPDGDLLVVVVEHRGERGPGQVRHRGHRLDSDLGGVIEPFPVTRTTVDFGEPADHRAVAVAGELLVTYQSLVLEEGGGCAGSPAEACALEQSLLLARFDLWGEPRGEVRPIVAHVPRADFGLDTFQDHCLLWLEGRQRLLVATAGSDRVTFREVEVETGEISAQTVLEAPPGGDVATMGNSLMMVDGAVWMLSSSRGDDHAITVLELAADYGSATTLARLPAAGQERAFPTGVQVVAGSTVIAHIRRPLGSFDPMQNPFLANLLVLSPGLELIAELAVGEEGELGMAHVHPTLTSLGSTMYLAWSRQGEETAPGVITPQVVLETYRIEGGRVPRRPAGRVSQALPRPRRQVVP